MTPTEKVFYDNLIEKGVDKEKIKFFVRDSPDFIVDGKVGYEVKKKEGNCITTSKRQINKILAKKIKPFLIIIDENSIIEEILLTKDILNNKYIGSVNINWENENLSPFFQKIDPKVIYDWKETINHNETIRERLEEALRNNTNEHIKK